MLKTVLPLFEHITPSYCGSGPTPIILLQRSHNGIHKALKPRRIWETYLLQPLLLCCLCGCASCSMKSQCYAGLGLLDTCSTSSLLTGMVELFLT